MLALDAGGLSALLGETGLIDHADAVGMAVLAGYPPLELVSHARLVPLEHAQIFLERTGRYTGGVGDRLNALAVQVAQLAGDVGVQVLPVGPAAHAAVKTVQVLGQSRLDPQYGFGVHAHGLQYAGLPHSCHRLAA